MSPGGTVAEPGPIAIEPFVRHRRAEGRPAAPSRGTLVCIHGLGESGLCYEGLLAAPELEAWDRLALDLPGYGKTPWADRPLSLEEHADFVAHWLGRHFDDPVVLAGHSMGGVIGQLLCEAAPERIRAFLNIEGNLTRGDCGFSGPASEYSLEAFLDHGLDEMTDTLYRDGLENRPLRTYYASIKLCDPRAFHRNSLDLVQASEAEDLAPRFAALPLPKLYLSGKPHGISQPSRDHLTQTRAPHHTLHPTGHWPFLDQPREFAEVVGRFLEGLG